jgi:hypothetical protein
MKYLLLWQILSLIIGIRSTLSGVKLLRSRDTDYLKSREEDARKYAKEQRITEEEALRRYVKDARKDPRTWRIWDGAQALGVGIVLLVAFGLLVLLDIGT